jgi:hypothetical protein
MMPLLRLQFVALYRSISRVIGQLLFFFVLFLWATLGHGKQEKAEMFEPALFAGFLALMLLLAWGCTLWSLESTYRCSAAGPSARRGAAAAFAAALAVPLGLFCLWIPGLTSSYPDESVALRPFAAMAVFVWSSFLVGSAAILVRNSSLVVRAFALVAAMAAGPVAVGLHVYYGVPGPLLFFYLIFMLAFGALYRKLEADHETQPGGSTLNRPSDTGSPPTDAAPPRPLSPLATGARPESVLLRWLFSRWYWWGYVALVLGVGLLVPSRGMTTVLVAFIGPLFPIAAWTGFQASPLSRKRAFLALFSPVFVLWLLVFGLQAVLGAVYRDTRYVTLEEQKSILDGVELTYSVARLRVPDGWIGRGKAKERIPDWPAGNGQLPVDVAQASRILSGLFRESFSLSVAPETLEALHPGPRQDHAGRNYDPARRPWIEAVATRFDPIIERLSFRQALLKPLLALFFTLVLGMSYSLHALDERGVWTVRTMIFLACLFGCSLVFSENVTLGVYLLPLWEAALIQPGPVFGLLALSALLLGIGYYRLFRRQEALAWR